MGGSVETETPAEPGVKRHFQYNFDAIRSAGGIIVGVSCVVQDITERRAAEDALRENQVLLSAVVEGTTDAIVVTDLDGRFLFLNQTAATWLGKTPEELIGRRELDFYPPDAAARIAADDQRIYTEVRSLNTQAFENTFEVNGTSRTYIATKTALRDDQGNIIGLVGIGHDITRRKEAEKALEQSEERLSLALDAVSGGVFDCRIPTDEWIRSDSWYELFGFERGELERWEEEHGSVIHPDDVAGMEEAFQAHVRSERDRYHYEFRIHHKCGEWRWLLGRGLIVERDADGAPLRMVGTDTDITAWKQNEQALLKAKRDLEDRVRERTKELQAANETLRLTQFSVDGASESIFWIGPDSRIRNVNEAVCKTLGYSRQELLSMTIHDIDPNFSREDWGRAWEALRVSGVGAFESTHRTRDGRMIAVEIVENYVNFGDMQYSVAFARDITARKLAEEMLRESEERFALALEATSEGVWDWNITSGKRFYSPQWCKTLGFDPSEVERHGRFWESLVHPDDLPRFYEVLNVHFDQKTELFECEVRLRTKSGAYLWILDRGKVVARDEDGKPLRMVGVDVDITERKQAEHALLESEQRYRSIIDSTSDALVIADENGSIVDWNPAASQLFGYSDEVVLGKPLTTLMPESYHESHIKGLERYNKTGIARVIGKTVELEGLRTDGSKFPLELSLSTWKTTKGQFFSGIIRDITERKRAEEHARQLQADLAHMSRLSSMGEMATGLAHELNQPLTVIANYAQGCVRRLKSNAIGPEELVDILGRIATQARRSGSIIQGLENLVRKSSALRSEIDVNQSIMEVAELANAEAAQHHAKARFGLEPNLPLVMADQTQLQQVILNLVQNGCEAIQDTPESRREVTVRTKQRGDRELEISVSDNGCGISKSRGERLFEPFFTTKAQGIGMGLAISRSIVEAHGGRLWATPNPDQGTTFYFTLPIVGGHFGDE